MSRHLSIKLGPMTAEDALHLLVGQRIGEGQFREVFEVPIYSGCVAKVSREHGNLSNVMEWILWGELKDSKWGKWLCPCYSMSPCGTVLLMEKAEPLERRPTRVPSFLADLKPENWGTHKGRPVAIDYGNNAVFTDLLRFTALVKAKWATNSGHRPPRKH